MTTLRAVGLIAVSSDKQVQGVSLDEQEAQVRARCEREGWSLTEMIVLPGVSRSNPDIITIFSGQDPQFAPYRRLRELINGKKFDVLVSYDNGRIARSKSLFVYIAENCIANKIKVCTIISGDITEDNEDIATLLGATGATAGLKRFVKMTKAAMLARMDAGLTITQVPPTHRVVRDDKGDPLRLEVREDRRRLFEDAALLLLEGTGWDLMALTMQTRFGHVNSKTGKRYPPSFYFRVFHSPFTWGVTAYGYMNKHGLWAFDESEPVPEGVSLNRQPVPPVPPVWTGERALAIQAELRRRNKAIHGHASPYRTYKFTGLFLCDGCERIMVIGRSSTTTIFWGCLSRRQGKFSPVKCDQRKRIRDDIAVEQLKAFFKRMAERHLNDVSEMVINPKRYVVTTRIESLKQELDALEQEIDVMIIEQSKAPIAVRERYQRLIVEADERRATLKGLLASAMTDIDSVSETESRRLAFDEMMHLGDRFWELETRQINQVLHRVMGRIRFVVRNGRIIDVRKKP